MSKVISKAFRRKLEKTIKILSKILEELKIDYRIFGSIVPAAILGKPQRKLGDIDLIVREKDSSKLFEKLRKVGYQVEKRRFRFLGLDFTWLEVKKKDLLELTLFIGEFDQKGNFSVPISRNLRAVAYYEAIKPARYKLYGASFIGVPAATAYYGALASKGNPKRKYDLAVFEAKKIPQPPKGYAVIDFYYQDKKLSFAYPFSCFLQDFIGKISLLLGGNYDFWRK